MGRRHRLHFELDRLKTSQLIGFSEAALRIEVIFLRLGSHKADRAPDNGGRDCNSERALRLFPQIAKYPCYQLFNADSYAKYFRGQQRPARQERLERLDQPPAIF